MMTTRAKFIVNEAFLFTEFGETLARKYFGDDVIDSLPRYVRGKNAGRIKEHKISWKKVESGGWVSETRDSGHVEKRVGKIIEMNLILCPWKKDSQVLKKYILPM